MRARARLSTEARTGPGEQDRSRIAQLYCQAPLMLRETLPKDPLLTRLAPWLGPLAGSAHVCLAAAGAGPIGGDQFRVEIDVGSGSALVLGDVSATLLLPGPGRQRSTTRFDVRVGAGATLVWLPEPIIAAAGCRHAQQVSVALDESARLIAREEVVLGRHGEQPGDLQQRLRVTRGGQPIYHQSLTVGPATVGWDSPAVVAAHRAIGSLLVVDPGWQDGAQVRPPALDGDAAFMPLAGPAVIATATYDDSLRLRRSLASALAQLRLPAPSASLSGARPVGGVPCPSA